MFFFIDLFFVVVYYFIFMVFLLGNNILFFFSNCVVVYFWRRLRFIVRDWGFISVEGGSWKTLFLELDRYKKNVLLGFLFLMFRERF